MRKNCNPGEPEDIDKRRHKAVRGMLSIVVFLLLKTVVRPRDCAGFSSNGHAEIQDSHLKFGYQDYSLTLLHASLESDF